MIVYASAKTNKIYYYFKVSDSVTYSVGAILSYFGTVSDSVAASLGPILSYAPTVSDSVSSSPGGISSYFFNLAVSVYDAIAKTASLSYPFTVSDLVEIININYNVTITYLLTVSSDVSQLSGNFTASSLEVLSVDILVEDIPPAGNTYTVSSQESLSVSVSVEDIPPVPQTYTPTQVSRISVSVDVQDYVISQDEEEGLFLIMGFFACLAMIGFIVLESHR